MIESWLIIGGGISGLGAAKLLRQSGHHVRVSDAKKLSEPTAKKFKEIGAEVCDGGHEISHLDGVDALIISPGFSPNHPLVQAAKQRNLCVQTEIDYALARFRGKLIAVTGTNGKSTTCALVGHVLTKAGVSNSVGGNIGDPPSAILAENRMGDVLVLELSSYQLEGSRPVCPNVAIFTSFSHDHIARHGSIKEYLMAKWKIFANTNATTLALVPHWIVEFGKQQGLEIPCTVLRYFANLKEMREVQLPGFSLDGEKIVFSDGKQVSLASANQKEPHNLLNSTFALLALKHVNSLDLSKSSIFLTDFRGLPHRCELIGYLRNYPVINDSKSTNVESTLVALNSQKKPVILMMGGQGKSEPYSPILAEKDKILAVVTFGASGREITEALKNDLSVYEFPSLKLALSQISEIFKKHPSGILFSPGCASFDEFENYEHRGEIFRHTIENNEFFSKEKIE